MRQYRLWLLIAGAASITACTSPSGGPSAAEIQTEAEAQAKALEAQADALEAQAALHEAISSPLRTPANVARDRYRHPLETLTFFGVEPDDTVVEIWPGGGWYTEVLAPYLAAGGGTLWAAPAPGGQTQGFQSFVARNPDAYAALRLASFPATAAEHPRVPDGTADVVLTFRNVHNWRMGYQREDRQDYAPEAFRQMYAMLKPGGVLGIVDHRLPENADAERERSSGYIKTSTIRRLAEQAGFRFAGASEVNANVRDTADWPNGVWTLPPTLALKEQDRERYLAVGESDRMTLRFVKPR